MSIDEWESQLYQEKFFKREEAEENYYNWT